MSKNNKNKQNKNNQEKLNNNKRKKIIISFTCIIILLILSLIIILISTNVKSDSKKIMDDFSNYFNSNEEKVILYYDSKDESKENRLEKKYLTDLSKQFKIDFLTIDISLLSNNDKNTIEKKLGISGTTPSVIITKNKSIISLNDGFIESHNLVKLLISSNILDENSKYKAIDNLEFIDYKKYKKLIDEKDYNIIVIGQSGCEYCSAVKPILNNISKAYKVNIYYFDVNDVDKKDLQEFFDKLPEKGYTDESLKNEGSFSMPTVLITKKGKIKSFIQGQQTLEKYISFFKEQNVIE